MGSVSKVGAHLRAWRSFTPMPSTVPPRICFTMTHWRIVHASQTERKWLFLKEEGLHGEESTLIKVDLWESDSKSG